MKVEDSDDTHGHLSKTRRLGSQNGTVAVETKRLG